MKEKINILFIEDNPVEAFVIQELFTTYKDEFDIELTDTLAEGLKRLQSGKSIQVVLLDLTLPDSEGINTFNAVNKTAPWLPIVVITGIDDTRICEEALQKGAQDYLIKGRIDGQLLIRSIRYSISRKQSEQKMSEAVEMNEKILTASSMAILTYKSTGQCAFANEAACKVLHFTKEYLLNQNFHHIESWKKSGLYLIAQKVLKTKVSYQKELHYETSQGKKIWLDFFFSVFHVSGEIHLLVIFQDISERKRIEEDLLWQQYHMKALLDYYPDAIYFKDIESRIMELSTALAHKLGYNHPEEVIGKTDFDLFSKEHAQKAFDDEQQVISTGNPLINVEEKEVYPDQPPTWVMTTKMPLRDHNNNIIGTFGISRDITTRKRAEEELYDSQQRYQSLFEDSPNPIWEEDFSEVKKGIDALKKQGVTDFRTYFQNHPEVVQYLASKIKVLGINKAVLDLHQVQNKEQLIQNTSIVFSNQSHKTLAEEFAYIAEGKRLFDMEQELLTLTHEQKFVIIRWSVASGYEHTLSRVLVSIIDITERKNAEEELQNYRDHLEQLIMVRTAENEYVKKQTELILNSVGEGIYGVNLEGEVTFINPAAEQMLGWSSLELHGKKQHELIHHTRTDGSAYPAKECPIYKAFVDGKIHHITDECFWRKDGSSFPVEYISTPIWENNQLVGAVVAFSDITLRKKTETSLRESEERYRMLADNVSDVIWMMGLNGKFLYISPSVIRQTGYTVEETMQRSFDEIFEKSSAETIRNLFSSVDEKVKRGERIEEGVMELHEYRKDGVEIWIEIVYSGIYGTNDQFFGLMGVSRDITEHKQLIEELQLAKAKAEIATKVKSEFLANMSHEIRTPMNAILGFSDLLYNNVKEGKQRLQVESIRNSAQSLLSIINDILDLSKIEAGKLQIQYQPVGIANIIRDIQNIFGQKLKEKQLSFYIEYGKDVPESIMIDEIRLRQILFNLIGNAVKFTEAGSVTLLLAKRPTSEHNSNIDLTISIQDTGIGIPKEQQQAIFEAFNQQEGQNTKKYGGTGLGLTITKRLVEMLNGNITVQSAPGKGSTFSILLKNIEIVDGQVTAKKEAAFNPESIEFAKGKILVCDDNVAAQKLMADLFENTNLSLLQATNGKEGFDLAVKYIPNIILMDLKMPVMNGKEAARMLRGDKNTQSIPIIAISASTKMMGKDQESQLLFDNFLLKPIKLAELFEILKKYLPHKSKEIEPAKESHFDAQLEINGIQKEQLAEIISTLEIEMLPKYEEALQNQRIDGLEALGQELVQLGKKYSFAFLEKFGNEVSLYADNFEVDILMDTLRKFPAIIENLKLIQK